jgi:hypothetical protein
VKRKKSLPDCVTLPKTTTGMARVVFTTSIRRWGSRGLLSRRAVSMHSRCACLQVDVVFIHAPRLHRSMFLSSALARRAWARPRACSSTARRTGC